MKFMLGKNYARNLSFALSKERNIWFVISRKVLFNRNHEQIFSTKANAHQIYYCKSDIEILMSLLSFVQHIAIIKLHIFGITSLLQLKF